MRAGPSCRLSCVEPTRVQSGARPQTGVGDLPRHRHPLIEATVRLPGCRRDTPGRAPPRRRRPLPSRSGTARPSGRGDPDLGGVPNRTGARRRRVDDEPDLARPDQPEDRPRADGRVGRLAQLRDGLASKPATRAPPACRVCCEPITPPARAVGEPGSSCPCRDRRSTAAPAPRPPPGRGGTSAAPRSALASATRGSAWMPMRPPRSTACRARQTGPRRGAWRSRRPAP